MKKIYNLFYFFIIVFVIISTNCASSLNSKLFDNSEFESVKSVSKAITDVIEKFYIENEIEFDFIIYGNSSRHISSLADEVTKKVSEKVKISLIKATNIKTWDHVLNQSAVIFVTSKKEWQLLQQKTFRNSTIHSPTLKNKHQKELKFLVYSEEVKSFEDLSKIPNNSKRPLNLVKSDLRFFEFFITLDKNFVNLSINLLFSENKCRIFTPTLLNSFDIKKQKWNKKLDNYNNFDNLHGCLLAFKFDRTYLWYHIEIDDEKVEYNGILHEILQLASKKHNFITHYTGFQWRGKNLHNQRNFQIKIHYRIFLAFGVLDKPTFTTWKSYGSEDFYYLVTKNDLYTNYEKLTMPFDQTTWILLLSSFGLTTLIIFLMPRCSEWIKIIVFGKEIRRPGYNALGIFFGISQSKLSRENFSRIILILFIWFCLIFRTCYQSKFFEFMTSDMRKPMPQSLDDLREMNYTIVCYQANTYETFNKQLINGRESPKSKFLTWKNFIMMYENAINGISNRKLAFFVNAGLHGKFNSTFKNSLTILHNERLTKSEIIIFKSNFFLQKTLNSLIDRFHETGITKHLIDYGTWYLHRPLYEKFIDPRRILSLADLEYGFVIWLVACSFSILVFLWEIRKIVYLKIGNLIELFFGIFGFLIVLKLRLNKIN